MLAIRLSRRGAKKHPFYRIVVTEKENKRDGRFLEIIGYYNPCKEPNQLHLEQERVNYWLKNGAQPTPTVSRLLKRPAPVPTPAKA
ncbi:MAG: small subunit ribosomal protein S16 [bacterium]|nr:MAG: small subunit ribosomal protein S16 [bacterium]